jgi:twitching motility protein PilT
MTTLANLDFEDVYISEKGEHYFMSRDGIPTEKPEGHSGPTPTEDLRRLLAIALERRKEGEFHIDMDDVRYRVAVIPSISETWFCFRKPLSVVPALDGFGGIGKMKEPLLAACGKPGLVIITGATGSGKSTFQGSLLLEAMRVHGGNAMCIEAPPELRLEGRQPKGHIWQIPVKEVDFQKGIERSLRVRPRFIMLGELRSQAAVMAAIQASLTGHLVLCTIHGGSIPQGILRMAMAATIDGNPAPVWRPLADAISVVAHLTRNQRKREPDAKLLIMDLLSNQEGVRTKIREGTTEYIAGDIELMHNRLQAGGKK